MREGAFDRKSPLLVDKITLMVRDPCSDGGVQHFFEDVMVQLLERMKGTDLRTLAAYLVRSYMKTSTFNEDLADVQSRTSCITEPTIVNQKTQTPLAFHSEKNLHMSVSGHGQSDIVADETVSCNVPTDLNRLYPFSKDE